MDKEHVELFEHNCKATICTFLKVFICVSVLLICISTPLRVLNVFSTGEAAIPGKEQPQPPKKEASKPEFVVVFGFQGGYAIPDHPIQSQQHQQLLSRISCILKRPAKDQPACVSNIEQLKRVCCNVILDPFCILCSFNLNHVQLIHWE